jgi:hypothetical protein
MKCSCYWKAGRSREIDKERERERERDKGSQIMLGRGAVQRSCAKE